MSKNDHTPHLNQPQSSRTNERKLTDWAGVGARREGLSNKEMKSLLHDIRDDDR